MKDLVVVENIDSDEISKDFAETHFTHILCKNGEGHFHLNDVKHSIQKNDIVILLPNSKIRDLTLSDNFSAVYLFLSFNLISKNNPDIGWGIKGYLFSKENPVVAIDAKTVKKCSNYFFLLREKFNDNSHRFKTQIINLQLQLFVLEMWNILADKMEQKLNSFDKSSIFQKFLQLVEAHCMEHREVDFYANLLFITPKYLSEICKKSSGKNASEWIQNYTTIRLILLLRNESLTFTEIADSMNFSSQSFFSRYVKKVLGVNPTEYRTKLK
ncbi:helix-turn-helix domain-containing protein [Joostella sp. CR20]|uniref:helix-turn-helix domain-containing protein n=1 Tax=Joostella sp. CR20 TaxID=2804312 RepID=UPI00313EB9C7